MARKVLITPVLNGFLVKVGCQDVVMPSILALTSEIARYYRDPELVEEEYLRTALNKQIGEAQIPPGRIESIKDTSAPHADQNNIPGTLHPVGAR